jgi:hypothetical protein
MLAPADGAAQARTGAHSRAVGHCGLYFSAVARILFRHRRAHTHDRRRQVPLEKRPYGCKAHVHIDEGGSMMIRKTTLFVATLFAAGTTFAFHCPQDMKKIDDAMAKNPKLTAAQTDEVKKYRAEGETLHKAGKHQESVDTLAKAMKILDIK